MLKKTSEPEEKRGEIPAVVRLALMTVLNHVEPGWENCVAVVKDWLGGLNKTDA